MTPNAPAPTPRGEASRDDSPRHGATEPAEGTAGRKRPKPGERRVQILQALATMLEQPGTERITTAVMEHRLPPGIKLAEEKLATAFGVSRTKIRQALTVLSREGLVRLHPNRGAFVTSPTVQEAIDLLATRRLVEPEIVRNVIARAGRREGFACRAFCS